MTQTSRTVCKMQRLLLDSNQIGDTGTQAFSTALAFYDGYRSARLPANLLQASSRGSSEAGQRVWRAARRGFWRGVGEGFGEVCGGRGVW